MKYIDLRSKTNRFLHTLLGKTGWSSTSDRNLMSFREWSEAKRSKRQNNFYHERKITRAFPTTHGSSYFFRKPTTFTIANSRDARHWSVTNLHKLSDQYHWALWNTHHIKFTFVTPTNKLISFLLIFELFQLIFYWKYSIFLHEKPHTWNMTLHIFWRHWRMTSKVRKRTSRNTKILK